MSDPYFTHEEPGFQVGVVVGIEDPRTVDDVDVLVRILPGKARYSASAMTLEAIRRNMDHQARNGESLNGRYLLIPDLLVLRSPGVDEIIDAVRDLVQSDNIDLLPQLPDDPEAE